MGRPIQTADPETLGFVAGSDNVWSVNFADGKVCDSAQGIARGGTTDAGTITDSIPTIQASSRQCAVCAKSLTAQQARCCSQACAREAGRRTNRRGECNGNWRGGRASHPSIYANRFKAANPEKVAAGRAVAKAIRQGHLVRPSVCQSCLCACKPDAHHWDYALPLWVEWLCRKCHVAADRLRQRGFQPRTTATTGDTRVEGEPLYIGKGLPASPARRQYFRHARTVSRGAVGANPNSLTGKRSA